MATYIISDLHLHESRTKSFNLFLSFLDNTIIAKHDTLYILGDFFEYYLGDDILTKFQKTIFKKLSNLHSEGLKVYLMHGNRDFLIGKDIEKKYKITIIDDPHIVTVENKKIQLMHGDLLCTDDIKYQKFRKFSRNKIIKKCFLMLPKFIRIKIANSIRRKSIQYQRTVKVDITESGLKDYIGNKSVIIHGHTHLIGTHKHNNTITRFVLGDWHNTGSYIVIKNNRIILYSFFPTKQIGSTYTLG